MSRRHPPELHEFLRSFIPGHTDREISKEVVDRFGIEMTTEQVKSYKNNHHIRSGTKGGNPAGLSRVFSPDVWQYIVDHHLGVGSIEMAERLNETFGTTYTPRQIAGFYKNHNLPSGVDGRFKKGNVPPNKGKKGMLMHPNAVATQFKKGSTPPNKLPIGTIIQKDDGYLWKKTGERATDWKQLHRLLWEEAHGPIPQGHLLIFLDGNRLNVTLDNLSLISRAEHIELNRRNLRFDHKESTESGILLARLNCEMQKRKRSCAAYSDGICKMFETKASTGEEDDDE